MKPFYAGLLGGAVLLAIIILLCIFSMNLHVYKVGIASSSKTDSLLVHQERVELIEELHEGGVILTPQEYTNNIVNYYNTAITLLVFLFIIFSFISYYHLKIISKDEIQKLLEDKIKDSKEIERMFLEAFTGLADERYQSKEDADYLRDNFAQYQKNVDKLLGDEESTKNAQIISKNGSTRKKDS